MDWRQIVESAEGSRGYVHYVDEARANGWFARAAQLCSEEAWQAAKQPPEREREQQLRLIHDAWEAISFGYMACDLSPWCDPIYRQEIVRAYGNQRMGAVGGDRGFGTLDRHWLNLTTDRGICTTTGTGETLRTTCEPTFASRQRDAYVARNPDAVRDRFWIVAQCALEQNAQLSTWLLNGPEDVRGSDGWMPDRSAACPAPVPGGLAIAWAPECSASRHIPTISGGEVTILPPMLGGGSYSIVQAIARSCHARGARRVIDDGVRNAFYLNLQTALAFDLLPEEVQAAAARAGIDLRRFNGNGPRPREFDTAFPVMYAVVGAIGAATITVAPWLGALLGIIVAAADLFTTLIGAPSLLITDPFGNLAPVFVTWAISGRPGADIEANRPRQVVPDPPDTVLTPSLMSPMGTRSLVPLLTGSTTLLLGGMGSAVTILDGAGAGPGGLVPLDPPAIEPPAQQSAPAMSTGVMVAGAIGIPLAIWGGVKLARAYAKSRRGKR